MSRVIIDGVELHVGQNGAVGWMSDWTRCDDLGLRHENYGPATYGHVTFFYDTKEEATP